MEHFPIVTEEKGKVDTQVFIKKLNMPAISDKAIILKGKEGDYRVMYVRFKVISSLVCSTFSLIYFYVELILD